MALATRDTTVIRRIRLVLLVITTVLLQTSVFPRLEISGVIPDVVLVGVVAVAFRTGPDSGAIYGFAAGLALDLFLSTPFGLSALAFAITGYCVGVVQSSVLRTSKWMIPIIAALGGLFGNVVFKLVGILVGQPFFTTHTVKVLLVSSLYDALISPVVFLLAAWATREGPTSRSRVA